MRHTFNKPAVRRAEDARAGINMGRPAADIDLKALERLLAIGCTREECAGVLGVSVDALEHRRETDTAFAETFERGRALCRVSIRSAQFRSALAGNIPMLMFLGKHLLGQKSDPDTPEEREPVAIQVRFVSPKKEDDAEGAPDAPPAPSEEQVRWGIPPSKGKSQMAGQ